MVEVKLRSWFLAGEQVLMDPRGPRLEVIENTSLHLMVPDLPGLIPVSKTLEDMQTVEHLVESYLKSTRTITLAFVPASNETDTRGMFRRAVRSDKAK